jgi:pyruvate,orthophosphate dikinase
MFYAEGILTARGGMTSHAAVVARGWGKPCICGCEALQVDSAAKVAHFNGVAIAEGDWVGVNGTTGEVLRGKVPTEAPELAGDLEEFMSWADAHRELGVLANADTPADAAAARRNGAEGIGLVRTEHMYFSTPERIAAMRRMIAAQELHMGEA